MNSEQINVSQEEPSESLVATNLTIDSSLSSCPAHPELPLTRICFDYFPSQLKSSIIRFKCEKCCMVTTNDSGIFFRSKWFDLKQFIRYSILHHNDEIDWIAFEQFQENLEDKLDKNDPTTLLPIIGQTDQMYNLSDVIKELVYFPEYYCSIIYENTSILSEIAFEQGTTLEVKEEKLLDFSFQYKSSLEILEMRLMELIHGHRQLKYLPKLQPPPQLSLERIKFWPKIFGENYSFKRLLTQSDSIEDLTIDLLGQNQILNKDDFKDVAAILASMKSLKRLNLSLPQKNCRDKQYLVSRGIGQVKNLNYLELKLEFGEEFITMIGSLKYLEHLKLIPLNDLLVRDFNDIKLAFFHSNQLKTLDIQFIKKDYLNKITLNLLISAITQQTQLVELNLEIDIKGVKNSGFICFEEMFQKLKFLEKLKLVFKKLEVKAGAIRILIGSLVHLQKLTHLRIYLLLLSEDVLRSLILVLPSLQQLKSLCLTLQDSNQQDENMDCPTEGKSRELLRLGSNLSQLKNLETLKLFFISNRLNLEDQELLAATIIDSTRDQINFFSLKVCLKNYFNYYYYRNNLSQQFIKKMQQIEKLTFLNIHISSNVAIEIFEILARMAHLRHLKVQITEETQNQSCLTEIQSSIGQMTNLSSFKLTIMNSHLRDMSLIPLIESFRKLQNNLLYLQFSLKQTEWDNLQNDLKELRRRLQSMKKLTILIIKKE